MAANLLWQPKSHEIRAVASRATPSRLSQCRVSTNQVGFSLVIPIESGENQEPTCLLEEQAIRVERKTGLLEVTVSVVVKIQILFTQQGCFAGDKAGGLVG